MNMDKINSLVTRLLQILTCALSISKMCTGNEANNTGVTCENEAVL